MSNTERLMDCSPEDVFAVLGDGWLYPTWVVGASRIRDVDPGFPSAGASLHHSVGAWPVMINDRTTVELIDSPRTIRLRVRAWPLGQGVVTLTCHPQEGRTRVVMEERIEGGPGRLLPVPLQDVLLHARNVETLRRLGYLAERGVRRGELAASRRDGKS